MKSLNPKKISRNPRLRKWQLKHLSSASDKYADVNKPNIFLSEALTGAGKTTYAVALFKHLKEVMKIVDKCVVVCPRGPIAKSWVSAFTSAGIVASEDFNPRSDVDVYVITYAGVGGAYLGRGRWSTRFPANAFLILDEIHHAERERTWGLDASSLAEQASAILALTATPWSAGGRIAILAKHGYYQNDKNAKGVALKTERVVADESYRYLEDLMLHESVTTDIERATTPISFFFTPGDAYVKVSRDDGSAPVYETLTLNPVTREDGKLIIPPQEEWPPLGPFVDIGNSELENAHIPRALLNDAAAGLRNMRDRATFAKSPVKPIGLITCKSIKEAHFVANYMEAVHHQTAEVIATKYADDDGNFVLNDKATDRLENLRQAMEPGGKAPDKKIPWWIVSVALVSEGVDLPWIKVVAYLNQITTALFLIQIIGRAIRRIRERYEVGEDGVLIPKYFDKDDLNATRAEMYLPAHPVLVRICDEIERMIPLGILNREKTDSTPPTPVTYSTEKTTANPENHCIYRGMDMDVELQRLLSAIESHVPAMEELGAHWVASVLDWISRGQLDRAREALNTEISRFDVHVSEPMDIDEDGVGLPYDARTKLVSQDTTVAVAGIRESHPLFRDIPNTAKPNAFQLVRREICQRLYGRFREFPDLSLPEKKEYYRMAQAILNEGKQMNFAARRAAE